VAGVSGGGGGGVDSEGGGGVGPSGFLGKVGSFFRLVKYQIINPTTTIATIIQKIVIF